jgi:periplasmic divalent cation tolerance protein
MDYVIDTMIKQSKEMNAILVLITTSSEEEAAKIAHSLVEERLAACVSIIRNIRSVYRWKGKVEDDSEVLMVAKTKQTLFDPLMNKVKELHSYAVPEIIAIPVTEGSEDYLEWLNEVTG